MANCESVFANCQLWAITCELSAVNREPMYFGTSFGYLCGMRRTIAPMMLLMLIGTSCNKIDDFNQEAELAPLEDGFRASTAIAYSVSLASRAFTGKALPSNLTFNSTSTNEYSGSGLIHYHADAANPLPFNDKITDITIAGLWNNGQGGVISVIFTGFDLAGSKLRFYGIHTIPVIIDAQTGDIVSIFAEQDIVIGTGSDTLMNLSLSKPKFDSELSRVNSETPQDVFVAVTQNVWHLTISPSSGPDIYKDGIEINGGGQIAEAKSTSGGVLYHAMIQTRCHFDECGSNPVHGTAFIQNIKAGSVLDFGTILMDFHSGCDGKAEIKLATGKYASTSGKNISLAWN